NDGAAVVIAPFSSSTTATGTYVVRPGDQANPLDTNSPLALDPGATLTDSLVDVAPLTIPAGASLRNNHTIIIGTRHASELAVPCPMPGRTLGVRAGSSGGGARRRRDAWAGCG